MAFPYSSGEVLTAADLNNGVNSWWLPAAQFSLALGSATLGVVGSWSNVAQCWQVATGNNGFLVTSFYAPQTGNFNLQLYYQGGGSGNFRLAADTANGRTPGTPGDTMFTLTGNSNAVTIASENGLARWTMSTSIPVDAGDLVNLSVGRNGPNPNDTSANTCYIFGVRVYYV